MGERREGGSVTKNGGKEGGRICHTEWGKGGREDPSHRMYSHRICKRHNNSYSVPVNEESSAER